VIDMTNQGSKLHISRQHQGDIAVLALSGEIRMNDGDLALARGVDEILATGGRKIVLDLSKVSYIDSSGLGRLVAEAKRIRQQGAVMRLAGLTPRIHQLLATLNIKALFEIFDNVEAALRSFT
jgi:anti-sigma B factor antagonist